LVIEDVEAGQFVQRDTGVEHRVGLTAVHLDMMSKVSQGLGEMSRVDTLSANVRFAAVGEVGEAKWALAQAVEFTLHVAAKHAM
jgi:hypothetical protein